MLFRQYTHINMYISIYELYDNKQKKNIPLKIKSLQVNIPIVKVFTLLPSDNN